MTMCRKKKFLTPIFFLFFLCLVLFPGYAFANGEKGETNKQTVSLDQGTKKALTSTSSKTEEKTKEAAPAPEAKENSKADPADKTPASKDESLPAKEEGTDRLHSSSSEALATNEDKDLQEGTKQEESDPLSPSEDKTGPSDGNLTTKTQADPGESKDPESTGEKAVSEEEKETADLKDGSETTKQVQEATEAAQEKPADPQAPAEEDASKADQTLIKEENPDVLEKGEVLEVKDLAKNPMVLGAGPNEEASSTVEVHNFEELKAAIEKAGNTKTTIKIMESFELTEAITIGKDQDIILTADNKKKADSKWDHVKQPADYADQGEGAQREVIEEARKRGEEALEKADLTKNPLPFQDKGDIIIKRAVGFLKDSLFKVYGKLTLGTEDTAIYIDGNKDVATAFDDRGAVIDVNGTLRMKNAVIMNSVNHHGYTGPIRVNEGGTFIMEGGRISSNTSYEKIDYDYTRPSSAGAVYVRPGGTFTMLVGLIDNNNGGLTGGIYAGDFFGSTKDPAIVNILGGIIANNKSNTRFQSGGGIAGHPKSIVTISDGIIAGNRAGVGGGIAISDQFIGEYSNTINGEYAYTGKDYEKFLKTNKAEANLNGGLIYKNYAGSSGGGVYVDTNFVNFGKTMILDNKSGNWGGGVYVSFPPRVQSLKDLLITENNAKTYWIDAFGGGNGGGLWNCPTGYVHIGDGHSVYVFGNNADGRGKDITFSKKTGYFKLNDKNLLGEFYSHISPVTKDGNIIKFINDKTDGVYIPDNLSYNRLVQHLIAQYNDALIKEAWKNSQTFIMGNTARNGGGFGSNANLETPGDEGDYKVDIHKKWDASVPADKIPNGIKVDIFIVPMDRDAEYVKANYKNDPFLYKYGEVDITALKGWFGRFEENYFNGADKQAVLDRLGIESWADIGLPEDVYSRDKGLPFTAEELAAKGYKYLFVERGDGFHVVVEESKPQAEKKVHAGTVEVERGFSDEWDTSKYAKKDQKIYFYFYDPIKKELTRFAETLLTKDNNFKSFVTHPIFLKEISKIEYYGEDRQYKEYEGWESVKGYNNKDDGYAFVLIQNADGSLTLQMPALYSQIYDGNPNVGFHARQTDSIQDIILEAKNHSVTITNYGYGNLDVEKTWNSSISAKDIPESITLYLRKDGKRVIESYDALGNPIYRKLVLTAEDGWKGSFDKLDPLALGAGRYTIEEDSDIFAPLITVNKDGTYQIRIEYADSYRKEGQGPNESTTTSGQFPGYLFKNKDGSYSPVELNLYLDGKKIDTKHFTFTEHEDIFEYGGKVYRNVYVDFKDVAIFKDINLPLYGTALRIGSYDVITNEPGLKAYNFYIQKDEKGLYTLYLPRLVIDGIPYDKLFIAKEIEAGQYGLRDTLTSIPSVPGEDGIGITIENYYGPNHQIEILKHWINAEKDKLPESITVIVTDKDGKEKEVLLTGKNNWTAVLDNLTGLLRNHGYTIKEVQIPNYTGSLNTGKDSIKVHGKDKDGKDITLVYTGDLLKEALESGNYRYELFDFGENAPEFNQANLDRFIRIEKQPDGSYIIYYAKDLKLTETLSVNLSNKYNPPEEPPETPPGKPPKTPPETPPETPEEPPEVPPITPPETPLTPITPPVNPPEKPLVPLETPPLTPPRRPGYAPKTGLPAMGLYLALSGISLLGLGVLNRKKED